MMFEADRPNMKSNPSVDIMHVSAQALARTHFSSQSHARRMSDMLEKLRE